MVRLAKSVRPEGGTRPIRVTLLYFGQARDAAGSAEEAFSLPTAATVEALLRESFAAHPAVRKVVMVESVQVAVNEELAERGRVLGDGDVVAILPPVAGG
ncbi:MAG: MoaD/ThiS family protein [Nitrososphaerales archaeon]